MLSMVTFVSTLVAIFAAGYMAGDPGYPRFFALIGLFVVLDDGTRALEQLFADLCLLGRRGRLQLSAGRFLAYAAHGGRGRDEGVSGQSDRRLRLCDRHLLDVVDRAQPRPELQQRAERAHAPFAAASRRSPGSPCCSSGRRRPRVPRFRFTSGCPTRWKARRRSRP